jgi:hypothetical protein
MSEWAMIEGKALMWLSEHLPNMKSVILDICQVLSGQESRPID